MNREHKNEAITIYQCVWNILSKTKTIFLIKFTLVTEYFAIICFNSYSRLLSIIIISRMNKSVTVTNNKKL